MKIATAFIKISKFCSRIIYFAKPSNIFLYKFFGQSDKLLSFLNGVGIFLFAAGSLGALREAIPSSGCWTTVPII